VDGVIDRRVGTAGTTYGIGFAIALPDDWNGRFLFQGGGGFDASFMQDQQASLDFAYATVGRVADVAKRVIAQRYSRPASARTSRAARRAAERGC
jgi:hypothetical protein